MQTFFFTELYAAQVYAPVCTSSLHLDQYIKKNAWMLKIMVFLGVCMQEAHGQLHTGINMS